MTLVKRYFLFLFVIMLLSGSIGWFYYIYVEHEEQLLTAKQYEKNAQEIRMRISNALLLKEKATLGMALSLSENNDLKKRLKEKKIPAHYYDELIERYKNSTLYKNIWIQIVDKEGVSLYRSWTTHYGDKIGKIREDLQLVQKDKKAAYSLSVGRYDFSIKAMVPIFEKQNFIGTIELISHFNSIDKILQKEKIESVVLALPKVTRHLKYPFTKLFVKDYYVANLAAPKELLNFLNRSNIAVLFKKSYTLKDGYLIVDYPLFSIKKSVIGHYLAFEKLDKIANKDLDYFESKIVLYILITLMAFAGLINIVLYYILREQKHYYKNILDSSNNIVLVNNKKEILDANKTFFKYFSSCKTLQEFREKHTCICNFFVDETGYLKKGSEAYSWLDYLLENSHKHHKVKMNIEGKIYYFAVFVTLISEEKQHYSVIFSDVTHEEEQKQELEKLATRDALTGVYNRRYYTQTIEKEMYNAKRYEYDLSLIMLDIDYFKRVNDVHGHSVGDEVLIVYSKLIQSNLRSSDIFCRVGGEEFIIILPHTNAQTAKKIAEKLRTSVAEAHKILDITMSFGVTQYIYGEDEHHLDTRVDKALYKAKTSGRNRVEVE